MLQAVSGMIFRGVTNVQLTDGSAILEALAGAVEGDVYIYGNTKFVVYKDSATNILNVAEFGNSYEHIVQTDSCNKVTNDSKIVATIALTGSTIVVGSINDAVIAVTTQVLQLTLLLLLQQVHYPMLLLMMVLLLLLKLIM